jgi:hypothetical protein
MLDTVISANATSTGTFGSRHIAGGSNACASGTRVSHQKKNGKRTTESRNGARNDAVTHPYDAPSVSPRMSKIMAERILRTKSVAECSQGFTAYENIPTKSSCFQAPFFTLSLVLSSGITK